MPQKLSLLRANHAILFMTARTDLGKSALQNDEVQRPALIASHPSRHMSLVALNRCIGKNLNTANILLRSRAWVRFPHPSYHRPRCHGFFQRQALHSHPTRQTHIVLGVSGDKSKTPEMVAKFYNLVTDFYE